MTSLASPSLKSTNTKGRNLMTLKDGTTRGTALKRKPRRLLHFARPLKKKKNAFVSQCCEQKVPEQRGAPALGYTFRISS